MSITKEFEKRRLEIDNWNRGYMEKDVEALLAHARSLEAMLKKHEWAEYEGTYYCPECLGLRDEGHKTDCQLAKPLEGV